MSPFAGDGLSITAIGTATVLGLIFTQIFASVAGGYIAGRVRSRWSIHRDEVFFRDTVHGLLTWANFAPDYSDRMLAWLRQNLR